MILGLLKWEAEKKGYAQGPSFLPLVSILLQLFCQGLEVFFFLLGYFSLAFYSFPLRQVMWINYIHFQDYTFFDTGKLFGRFYICDTEDHSSSKTLFSVAILIIISKHLICVLKIPLFLMMENGYWKIKQNNKKWCRYPKRANLVKNKS